MNGLRISLGAAGVGLLGYGAFRIVTTARLTHPGELARWFVGALLLHDAVLAPAVALIGAALSRVLGPRAPRALRYVSATLVAAAMTVVVAIPLIHRRGHTPAGSTLETRNYAGGLAVVIGVIVAAGIVAYLIRVVRDRET